MDLIQALKELGFTQQEAIIYIQLCKHSEITGYEAAKLSGISRSNAYAALSSLVDKGYAYVIEESSVKYMPVSKDDLIRNARRNFDETISIINDKLEFSLSAPEPYITISDENHIINKIKNIIGSAKMRVYISCNDSTRSLFKKELDEAGARDLKIVLLSPGKIEDAATIKIIADTSEVLAGTLSQSIYSKNSTFVQLIRETFINEIKLKELTEGKEV